jgi:hypothetical protein
VPYSDYTGYPNAYGPYPAAPTPYNTTTQINNPNEWQPLSVQGVTQQYIGPHWGLVIPFALTSGAHYRPATGPQTTPFGPGTTAAPAYVAQAQQILAYSAGLTDTLKMIVEFWRPGTAPTSGNIPRQAAPAPPAMWCQFAQFVSQRDKHDLGDDVKMFFALGNALLDAGIACWDAKRFWNSVRPITAVHYLSTVPLASGSFLDPRTNTAPVSAWAGPCQGTHTIDGATWQPYQPASVVTPAFPEYFSGHSTFSAAGAQILASFTGHDTFGGAATFAAGSSTLEPGCTPATDITLSWATFSEAADQAGLSRRYGGIHFQDGDLVGRAVGRQVGMAVWAQAQAYITGRATPGS